MEAKKAKKLVNPAGLAEAIKRKKKFMKKEVAMIPIKERTKQVVKEGGDGWEKYVCKTYKREDPANKRYKSCLVKLKET